MKQIKNMVAAFQFLTVLPLPVKTNLENLEQSITWYPITGAVIGLFTGYGFQLLSRIFPETICSGLTLLIYIILSRGLHLDGFMDTIDGFFSSRPRTRILEIMKEPTVGSFAVLGSGLWFILLMGGLPTLQPMDHVMLHTLTRFAILLPALFFSYPRESGTGKFFVENVTLTKMVVAMLLVLGICAAVYFSGLSSRLLCYVACFVAAMLTAFMVGLWSKKKIGGITGDVLGFTIEAAHIVLVLVILMFKI